MITTEMIELAMRKAMAKHVRSDWSDRSYACNGCRLDADLAFQKWVDANPDATRAELIAQHDKARLVDKPGWTLEQYNAHVVGEAMRIYRQLEDEYEPLASLDLPVRVHNALFKAHILTIADLRRALDTYLTGPSELRGLGYQGYEAIVAGLRRWDERP